MKRIGMVLGSRYALEERLGAGAMGTVYRARHLKIGRTFAVKVLHRELLAHPGLVERFEQEAVVAGRLQHPNVVQVVDFGETDDGTRYTVMDLVPGTPLSALMGAPMAADRVVSLVMQLLDGLQHAHDVGLIHRDFKPDNVIVERDDDGHETPRIVDFGIAILQQHASSYEARGRLTTMGVVLGTPEYMAPEQARGEVMDHRADLFALGITCYAMLTGKLPFEGSGVEVAIENMTNDTPAMGVRVPCVTVDPLLEAFTRRLARKNPKDRPATASAARALLELIVTDRAAAAIELGLAPRPKSGSAMDPQCTIPIPVHADTPCTTPLPVHADPQCTIPMAVYSDPVCAMPIPVSAGAAPPRVAVASARKPAHVARAPRRSGLASTSGMVVVLAALVVAFASPAALPSGSTVSDVIELRYPDRGAADSPPRMVAMSSAPPASLTVLPATRPAPIGRRRPQVVPPSAEPAAALITTEVVLLATSPPPPSRPLPTAIVNDNSPVAVASLYKQLGMQLASLARTHGSETSEDLWVRYRHVRFQDTIATATSRAHGLQIMLAIQRETARRATQSTTSTRAAELL